MSSAEDTSPLTASPSASPSTSAPEEFPVEPVQDKGNDLGSSASLPAEPAAGGTIASDSPDAPVLEPAEEEAGALSTKPLPKVNAVAHEVRVKVTGARPGKDPGERELFSESATTVLVFEKGGVIRLSAAVAPGQLLFLSNEESKREVVAQVMRKRTFRPTECYVELEFTEPAPRFWGMEFSAATALLPRDAKEVAAAELVASAETTTDELSEPAPAPSAEEVLALKEEVEALRGQLKLLQTQSGAEQAASGVASTDAAPAPITGAMPPADTPSAAAEVAPSVPFTSKSLPIETEPPPAKATPAEQELPPTPVLDFSSSLPKSKKRSFRARGNFTPGFRAGALRLALLTLALVVTIIGAAWYKDWLPWKPAVKKIEVASWAGSVTTPAPMSAARSAAPVTAEAPAGSAKSQTDRPASANAAGQSTATASRNPGGSAAESEDTRESPAPAGAVGQPANRGKPATLAVTAKRPPNHSPATSEIDSAASSVAESVIVPPKLIRSARAVASLDDLRDFETGSVIINAIVDTSGNVVSMNVLSGPPSLHAPAMEALKGYKYEPATRNGKPVPARVTVKIQFHFE